jgi:hypothetical protein
VDEADETSPTRAPDYSHIGPKTLFASFGTQPLVSNHCRPREFHGFQPMTAHSAKAEIESSLSAQIEISSIN